MGCTPNPFSRIIVSIVQQSLSNQRLMEQGVPELRLPCRDSGIHEAKPNRRADAGGNDLDQAALRESCEANPLV